MKISAVLFCIAWTVTLFGQEADLHFAGNRERLSNNVNTKFIDTHPVISPDGMTLYFARQKYQGNTGGKSDQQDIFFSELENGVWSPAQNIGPPLNDQYANGVFSVTPDMNTLLVINGYRPDGTVEGGASLSNREKTGWTKPRQIIIKDLFNYSKYVDFFLTSSGNALIIAAQLPDSKGDQDLYVSFRSLSGNWAKPKNLGSIVNTGAGEFAPFLAADHKTLFFASYGHGGLGESDIFYTKRLDDTWLNWSKPRNLGSTINTGERDEYFTITAKGDYAYFVSEIENSNASRDIYRIELPSDLRPEPVLLVSGRVFNSQTKQPLEATIFFHNLETGAEEGVARSNPNSGKFKIVLPKGKRYGYLAQVQGYIGIEENIDLKKITQYGEFKKNLYLVPIEIGQTSVLNNIFYEYRSPELLPESFPELDRLSDFLLANPTVKVELAGHTNNQGKAEENQSLSESRVQAIANYFEDKGVPLQQVAGTGYGSTRPLARSRMMTRASHDLNERIELTITSF